MPEVTPFEDHINRINRQRQWLNRSLISIQLLRSVLLGLIFFLIWSWLRPEAWGQQLVLFAVATLVFYKLSSDLRMRLTQAKDWMLALEVSYPETADSPFLLDGTREPSAAWHDLLALEANKEKSEARRLLTAKLGSLILPFVVLLSLSGVVGNSWMGAIHSLERLVMSLSYGAHLRVVEGTLDGEKTEFRLRKSPLDLTVLEQNLIEVSVLSAPDEAPMLQLKDKSGKALQTFRLTRDEAFHVGDAVGKFAVTFAVDDDVNLFVNTLSEESPAVQLHVKKLPVPKVQLRSYAPADELWPDDRALPLQITVRAEHPLQTVHLEMRSGERKRRELVSDVLAQDKLELQTSYNLPVESFMEQDIEEIEIIAVAQDRAMPLPLTGRSAPLVIKVASAYGRYREALKSLSEAKQELDAGLQAKNGLDGQKLKALGEKIAKQAEESPFFDGLDRQQIQQFRMSFAQLAKDSDMQLMVQTSEDLNRFLFDHESLDDRERDRDFFIAARTLSRLLEQKPAERGVAISKVTERMKHFLEERHKRWEQRVSRLDAQNQPQEWGEVQKKPFQKALEKMEGLDSKVPPATDLALQSLSQTVESYRQWIEALENKEDNFRQQQEQKRQQGLANAQDQLRELQKRQGQISGKLDKADQRKSQEVSDSWASVRLDQNSNVKGTRELESQMRSMSPAAAQRMKAAADAMEQTLEQGNQQEYVAAESSSDLAGRLLVQAESAARKSQQDQSRRGRRRRVTSDQYYGNQVAGGDVDMRRDYQVNRRYREDVLDDVRSLKRQEGLEDSTPLLEEYLRKVIR